MARLRPEQLDANLRKGLTPIYWVSGDEPLLVQEACDTIRQAAQGAGFSERELYHADASFDWNQLLSAANSLSLFSEQRLLEVRLPSGKPGDRGSKALLAYTEAPAPDSILLLVTGRVDRSALNTKWAKALEKVGTHVQVWPLSPANLPRWIGQRLQAAGIRAESDAIDLLASRVEGNLLAAAQEIEKLKLLAPTEGVGVELMASVVADSARYNVFALTDRALRGDARGAVKTLQGLRGEGTEPLALLWALTREIRALVQIGQAMAQGASFERAAQPLRLREQQKPLIQSALRRLSPPQCQHLLRKANGIDKAIKGMRNASPWDELLDLTLNLAGVRSLHPSSDRLALKLES